MNYKIKQINLKTERAYIIAKMDARSNKMHLKYLSRVIYRSLFEAEMSCDDWRLLGFESKAQLVHDAKRMAAYRHKEIMKALGSTLESIESLFRFHYMNRIIKDHYEKETLKDKLDFQKGIEAKYFDYLFSTSK